MRIILSFLILSCAVQTFQAADAAAPLSTVSFVDIPRYMGTWYEIAKLPNWFEKGLVGVTANYTLLPNGKVRVLNSGYMLSFDGKLKKAKGKAVVVDKQTNAKLKVSFFWPFYGDYWILELSENYEYVVVGTPSREFLWILSRTPQMDSALYADLVQLAAAKGFDTARLELNPQRR